MDNTYKLKDDHKNCSFLKYFSDHPISEWSFIEFEAAVNKDKPIPPNATKAKKNVFVHHEEYPRLKYCTGSCKDRSSSFVIIVRIT